MLTVSTLCLLQPATATSTPGGAASTWSSTSCRDARAAVSASTAGTTRPAGTATTARRASTATSASPSPTARPAKVPGQGWEGWTPRLLLLRPLPATPASRALALTSFLLLLPLPNQALEMTSFAPTFPAIPSPWSPQTPGEDKATEIQKVLTAEHDLKSFQVLSLINHASSAPIATANVVITL